MKSHMSTFWTGWKLETVEMLKSLFRMDEDQSARRVAQKYLKVVDADYYEFESEYTASCLFSHFFNSFGMFS